MGTKAKYAPDLSFEDISTYVREHTRATGYRADIVLLPGRGRGGEDMASVSLVPADAPVGTPGTVVTRGPFPPRAISRQMSVLLHLVAQAYQELEVNPWLWTPERRAAARGEG